MTELTLPQRLLVRIGELSERSDVIVHRQTHSWSSRRLGKWEPKLPADMFAFYKVLNGITFHYGFTDAPDSWHGLQFVALDDDGRKTIDTVRGYYRLPYQAAKKYPEYFFQPGEVSATSPVLFFFGSDDAWGVIMIGEGESASFHHWDNDGFVRRLSGTFTEIVERLIARGFAHTWAYSDSHPDTDDVLARLAKPAPPRKTVEVKVESLTERSPTEHRKHMIRALSPEKTAGLVRALGLAKQAKGLSPEDTIALIEGACASVDAITEKTATAAMKAIGYHKRNRADFAEHFQCAANALAYVRLHLTHIDGPRPLWIDTYTLSRVLHGVPEFHVTDDLPFAPEILRFMDPSRHGVSWTPFVGCSFSADATDENVKTVACELIMDAARARGMEVGKTYASTALIRVESKLG